MKLKRTERTYLVTALQHLRHAMLAYKNGVPAAPAMHASEEWLLRALFDESEVDEYLASAACEVYGRERRLT